MIHSLLSNLSVADLGNIVRDEINEHFTIVDISSVVICNVYYYAFIDFSLKELDVNSCILFFYVFELYSSK